MFNVYFEFAESLLFVGSFLHSNKYTQVRTHTRTEKKKKDSRALHETAVVVGLAVLATYRHVDVRTHTEVTFLRALALVVPLHSPVTDPIVLLSCICSLTCTHART